MYDRISDYYEGKSIFLTGATGYLGSVLLEILLRCVPGIKHVYLLLRPAKGLNVSERKNNIFRKKIFEKLLKQSPDITDKVKLVEGDVSLPHLGISEEDLLKITQEVTIVIHSAAIVSFNLSFKNSIQTNSLGTRSVLELCRKLKKCEVLAYTSTIITNWHRIPKPIEEEICKSTFPLETVLTDIENKDDEWFLQYFSKHNCKWPNSYGFSKYLAENILFEEATDIPVVIIRPAIILGTLKGPSPGYVEYGTGCIDLILTAGRGFCSVLLSDDVKMHLIPADIVANTIIASTWLMVTNRFSSPFIVNSSCGEFWESEMSNFSKIGKRVFRKNVLPNSLQEPSFIFTKNYFLYKVIRFYKDILPYTVLDIVAHYKGDKFRLMPIYKKIENLVAVLKFFTLTSVTIGTNNFKNISKLLHPEDREIFYTDLTGSTVEDILTRIANNPKIKDWGKDKLSPNKRKHEVFVNTMKITFIKRFSLLLIISFIYIIISKVLL